MSLDGTCRFGCSPVDASGRCATCVDDPEMCWRGDACTNVDPFWQTHDATPCLRVCPAINEALALEEETRL